MAELPFEAVLCGPEEPPVYQRIAPKALRLWELGLSTAAIARQLGVTDKTVTKAIRWLRTVSRP